MNLIGRKFSTAKELKLKRSKIYFQFVHIWWNRIKGICISQKKREKKTSSTFICACHKKEISWQHTPERYYKIKREILKQNNCVLCALSSRSNHFAAIDKVEEGWAIRKPFEVFCYFGLAFVLKLNKHPTATNSTSNFRGSRWARVGNIFLQRKRLFAGNASVLYY